MIKHLKCPKVQPNIVCANPKATWIRKGRDTAHKVCHFIMAQGRLTDDIQIDRWVNEGGAIAELQLNARPN
jgi:hypothetical protein